MPLMDPHAHLRFGMNAISVRRLAHSRPLMQRHVYYSPMPGDDYFSYSASTYSPSRNACRRDRHALAAQKRSAPRNAEGSNVVAVSWAQRKSFPVLCRFIIAFANIERGARFRDIRITISAGAARRMVTGASTQKRGGFGHDAFQYGDTMLVRIFAFTPEGTARSCCCFSARYWCSHRFIY